MAAWAAGAGDAPLVVGDRVGPGRFQGRHRDPLLVGDALGVAELVEHRRGSSSELIWIDHSNLSSPQQQRQQ